MTSNGLLSGLALGLVAALFLAACSGGSGGDVHDASAGDDGSGDAGDHETPDGDVDSSGFKDPGRWSAYAPSITDSTVSAKAKGYYGAVFDGRYVYYVPCRSGNLASNFHGVVLRFDTQAAFTSNAAWDSYDAGDALGDPDRPTVGYAGGAFDGRTVYFAPYADGTTRHARVLAYDTEGAGFANAASWRAFDAGELPGLPANSGYDGAVYDGTRYVYFVPYGDQNFAHGIALRYDKTGGFTSPGSWESFNVSATDSLVTRGYYGGAFDGRYVYFAPFSNGGDTFHGNVLRFDTAGAGGFVSASNWNAFDASEVDGLNTVGYKGAVFDGRHLTFVPFRDGLSTQHSRVLRYDTTAGFKSTASWQAVDVPDVDGLVTKGYVGAEFDGRYIFFIPYQQDASPYGTYHANVLRFDTQGDFKARSAWSAFDAGAIGGLKTKGMKYGCFDGSYVYFVPYNFNDDPANNGHLTYSRRVVRYSIDP